jgi:molybdopterin converting factor small subunit
MRNSAVKVGNGAGKMSLQVKFFASLREEVGMADLTIEATSMAALRGQLNESLSQGCVTTLFADGVQIAINQKLVAEDWRRDDFEMPPDAEVAFLPRVTGG